MSFKNILVATDGSELSCKAVDQAIDLAATLKAELTALRIVPRYSQAYFEGAVVADPNEVKEVEKQWAEAAQKTLDEIAARAMNIGLEVKTIVSKSDIVSDAIISTAKKSGCDLIVMASHGRKGIKRLLLGSETQHVLAEAHIPVLVLR